MRVYTIWIKCLLSTILTLALTMKAQGISNVNANPANPKSPTINSINVPFKQDERILAELSLFLKLEPEILQDKLKKQSLAEIANEQGILRTELKSRVIALLKERTASHPKPLSSTFDFSEAADKLIDVKGGWNHYIKQHPRRLVHAEELAKLLKMTPDQLKKSLQSGKSLAKIAEENRVSVQSVIDQQVRAVMSRFDRLLAEGKLTKEQYEKRKANVNQFITEFVNGRFMKPKENHFKHRSISQTLDKKIRLYKMADHHIKGVLPGS